MELTGDEEIDAFLEECKLTATQVQSLSDLDGLVNAKFELHKTCCNFNRFTDAFSFLSNDDDEKQNQMISDLLSNAKAIALQQIGFLREEVLSGGAVDKNEIALLVVSHVILIKGIQ
jgi:hypothetical protein